MQPFTCPQCGHKSSFDPWAESAHCPACGFTPPKGVSGNYIRWAQRYAYQPLLDELLSHWNGSHRPDPAFTLGTAEDAIEYFHEYQRALGEDPRQPAGPHVQYVREYQPNRQEVLIFAGAYLLLRRGNLARAAQDLGALTFTSPQFVDAWVWLTATTGDVAKRRDYLAKATDQDAGHPLARDALAILLGRVPSRGNQGEEKVAVAQCPQCAGALHYAPGATDVVCSFCGHRLELALTNVVDGQARALHGLRIQRRHEGHVWTEAQRVVHCRTCGADLTMTRHMARLCPFCGSANVLVRDSRRTLEQPDGLLPFQIDRQQAAEAIRRAQNTFSRRLRAWLRGEQPALQELQGLYLPFWVFDGIVEAYRFTADWATTDKETQGLSTYENLLLPAVDVPSPAVQGAVYPFRLERLAPYEPRLLADWPARLYTLDVELMAEQANTQMIELARQKQRYLPTSTSRSARRSAPSTTANAQRTLFQVLGTTYQLVLLPVWLGSLAGDGEQALAVVNGQSGKAVITAAVAPGRGQGQGQNEQR